jgi:hypothetical protein
LSAAKDLPMSPQVCTAVHYTPFTRKFEDNLRLFLTIDINLMFGSDICCNFNGKQNDYLGFEAIYCFKMLKF